MDECKPLPQMKSRIFSSISSATCGLNLARSLPSVKRRNLNLKPKLESSSSYFSCQALSSRRFQRGFDRVNLHRPTFMMTIEWSTSSLMMESTSLPWNPTSVNQGLTLVHFSAQLERFL